MPLQTVKIEYVFSQCDYWRESGAPVDVKDGTYINDYSSLNMKPRNLERKAANGEMRASR